VILVQNLFGLGNVEALLGLVGPRQTQDPVDVVANDRRLGAGRVHHLELLQLLSHLGLRLLAHLLGLELLFDLLDLVLEFVPFAPAELLLDRLHLLVQVVLLLRLLHLLLDAGADLLFYLKDLDLGLHQLVEPLEALLCFLHFEQALAISELDRGQIGGDGVAELGRVVDALHAHQDFGLNLLVELDVDLERALHAADQRFDLDVARHRLRDLLDLDQEVVRRVEVALDARALPAFDQHLDRAVGKAQKLHDRAERADDVDVIRRRIVGLGALLRGEKDLLVARHRLVEGGDALFAADEKLRHHVRKHDDVAERQGRNHAASGRGSVTVVDLEKHDVRSGRAVLAT
jgi:hypothetical protein